MATVGSVATNLETTRVQRRRVTRKVDHAREAGRQLLTPVAPLQLFFWGCFTVDCVCRQLAQDPLRANP
jgi:hypothetical protein